MPKKAVGLEELKELKSPSITKFPPKQPTVELQVPGMTQLGLGIYSAEGQPLLLTMIPGVDPLGIGLLVKEFPLSMPDTPVTEYGPAAPLIVKETV